MRGGTGKQDMKSEIHFPTPNSPNPNVKSTSLEAQAKVTFEAPFLNEAVTIGQSSFKVKYAVEADVQQKLESARG